jgi:hypothetical protein
MTLRFLGTATLFALALSACSNQADDSNIAVDNSVNAAEAANADIEVLPPSEGNGTAAPAPAAAPNVIPPQYRGRWGMNANDCDPAQDFAAKGLIDIGERTIKFYESRATLKAQKPAIATSFAGDFAFTGEGHEWTRTVTLTRTGDTLKRADDEGSYIYTKCP